MPRTSKAAKLQHSDSEGSILVKPAPKRQKLDFVVNNVKSSDSDIIMVDASQNYDPNKNGNLKGRKRFNADLADLQEAVKFGLTFDSLVVKRVRAGDDEGSVEVVIEKGSLERVVSVHLLISDTSEYPNFHSLFCYSPDEDLSAKVQKIIDEIAEEPARSLGCTIRGFVQSVARAISASASKVKAQPREDATDEEEGEEEESDGVEDFDAFDYDDDIPIVAESDSVTTKIQEMFVDVVATEYRPGFIGLPGDDFVLSISLPVITLANLIPPRALMAWDRRLLASSQHLTLLISGFHGVYPVLEPNATYTPAAKRLAVNLNFKVGLSERYKPGVDQVREVIRKHGLIMKDAEDELELLAAQQPKLEWGSDQEEDSAPVVEEEVIDRNRFDRFSLSSSLESLMDQSFLKLVQIRRKFGLGWAGAELLHTESEKVQMKEDDVLASKLKEIGNADREESRLSSLPYDPLLNIKEDEPFNLLLTAFCYLIRRLSLCTRYCTVCHNRLQSDYESLKPYVCDSKLCAYQYYTLNRGPSLEYEIVQNPQTVDLLVSLAFTSAGEGAMDDPLPIGMGLRVPLPDANATSIQPSSYPLYHYATNPPPVPEVAKDLKPGSDGLVDFDELTRDQMRSCIVKLIDTLPPVMDMKKHLEQKVKVGKRKPKLQDIDPDVLPAAWSILRWCVASCTAHIEAITSPEETIKGLDSAWRQFRMTVGAPAAEANFRAAIAAAGKQCRNVEEYPVIYAFHGSPLRNWHSIIRHGLWYRTISHGRAYGDGVYLAKDGLTSVSYLTQASHSPWSKSLASPSNCMALTEVVNLPSKFVSQNPHYVVKDTHWIMCRYLLVKGVADSVPTVVTANVSSSADAEPTVQQSGKRKKKKSEVTPYVKLDPKHRTQMGGKVIEIPDPAFQLETLLSARNGDYIHEDADAADLAIFQFETKKVSASSQSRNYDLDDDDDDYLVPVASSSVTKTVTKTARPKNDWKHDAEYVDTTLANLMLPPFESTPLASLAIQRELKSMIKEQDAAGSLTDLGWYLPPELIGDNLYQWIVEMHSLDPVLPIAKDMKTKKVNSIIMEIRFPPLFPNSPPFFRIITPRFLPFIHGGGGHVTGGGSICMDLLTSDGWLPSYSISAVLMQIRLAISNLEPRPARLARNWNEPYGILESLAGFKRAAATHNWTVPEGLDRLVR